MNIADYQRWFAEYDHARALDLVEPSQVTVHLMEEVGEIAREVLYLEGYRDPAARDDAGARLSAEIGDTLVFLTKIALHYGIDLETVMQNVMAKAEKRWPLDEAHREMERYVRQQQIFSQQRLASWKERNTAPAGDRPSGPHASNRGAKIQNRKSKIDSDQETASND